MKGLFSNELQLNKKDSMEQAKTNNTNKRSATENTKIEKKMKESL